MENGAGSLSVNKKYLWLLIFVVGLFSSGLAQNRQVSGFITTTDNVAIPGARIMQKGTAITVFSDSSGFFRITLQEKSPPVLSLFSAGFAYQELTVSDAKAGSSLHIQLQELRSELDEIFVRGDTTSSFGKISLQQVEQFGIYAGKKTEVIVLKDIIANKATNNARQIFGRAVGMNIWESDAAGLQLGIGGRGLSPNRTSNFNTRQNGYDIAADALGYPESYYTPPMEALDKIDIVRGAASLQYGTQFGGMLNFRFKRGSENRPLEVTARQTVGSWNFINSFTSAGGTVNKRKLNYYTFFQYRQGDGWRPNSEFQAFNGYGSFLWQVRTDLSLQLDLTRMTYLAQQPGGLTDRQFETNPRQSLRKRNWFNVNWNLAAAMLTWDITPRFRINSRTFALHASRGALGNLERINVADLGGKRTLIDGQFRNLGNETRLLTRYRIGNQEHTLLGGIRLYNGNTRTRQGDASDGTGPDFVFLNPGDLENADYRFPSRNGALFLEQIFRLTETFTLTPGIRAEIIETQANGYFKQRVFDNAGNLVAEQRREESVTRNRHFLLVGIGASWEFHPLHTLYSNISQNYRAINFSDLRVVNPNFAVDPNIQDERGFSLDVGWKGQVPRIAQWEVTAFHIRYADRIGQVLRADRPPLFLDYRLRTNIADADITGVELFGEVDLLRTTPNRLHHCRWTIFVNGAFMDARYRSRFDTSIDGNRVEMVAPGLFRTGTTFSTGKWQLAWQLSHTARHFSDATNATRTATAVEGVIPAYSVMDVSVSWSHSGIRFEGSINNLANARYFTRRAEAYPGPGIIPSDGCSFYLTMQFVL